MPNEPSFTSTSAVTYTFTTPEELRAINEERECLTSRKVQQEVLDIIDGKVPTLPMWTLFHLPSWLVNFLFWLKKKAR